MLEELSTIDELSLNLPLRIPEIVVWKGGIPQYILRYNGKKVIKLSGKNINKKFVYLHFCEG